MKGTPHQKMFQMETAFHWLATQFCAVNLLRNVLQSPQNILQIKTQGPFHLDWKEKRNHMKSAGSKIVYTYFLQKNFFERLPTRFEALFQATKITLQFKGR